MFNAGDSFGYLFKKNDPIHSLNNFATSPQTIDRENYPRVLEHIIHTQQQQGGGEHDQEQEEDVKLDFPSDNWLFDAIHQQQEFEF